MGEASRAVMLKSLDAGAAVVAGYGVVFGEADLTGETFTPETDYALNYVPAKWVMYDHGMGDVPSALGQVLSVKRDEMGLWVEAQLDRSRRYVDQVLKLVEQGALGWSSGSIAHLVRRDGGVIKSWPIVEFSLTPTPAEPRTLGVTRIKGSDRGGAVVDIQEDGTMSEVEVVGTAPAVDDGAAEVKALEGKVDALSTALNALIQRMETEPAIRKAGYFTVDGGKADAQVKSMGDFLLAVKRNDMQRLASVYGAVKDFTEGVGAQGGFLVPHEYASELLQASAFSNQVVSRVRRVPVNVESGEFPALDQFTAPTAGVGNTAFAGGLTTATTAEGGTLTETQATFRSLQWRLAKVGGYVEVTNELIADSPTSIEALLRGLIQVAVAAKLEYYILRGSGVGQPLGILNAACTIGVTTATNDVFAYADALAMLARFKSMGGQPVWIIHPSVWPDIGKFEVSSGSGGVWQANLASGLQQNLLGYPIIVSEHMPQANGDDVILADLSAYLLFDRGALSIAYSDHAAFTADKGTWRFTQRVDGKPWLIDDITLADPTGSYTVSSFVYHDD